MLQTLERTNIFDARVLTAAHADALRALAGPGGLPLLPCLHPALEEGQIVGDYAGQDELQAAAALLPLYAEDPLPTSLRAAGYGADGQGAVLTPPILREDYTQLRHFLRLALRWATERYASYHVWAVLPLDLEHPEACDDLCAQYLSAGLTLRGMRPMAGADQMLIFSAHGLVKWRDPLRRCHLADPALPRVLERGDAAAGFGWGGSRASSSSRNPRGRTGKTPFLPTARPLPKMHCGVWWTVSFPIATVRNSCGRNNEFRSVRNLRIFTQENLGCLFLLRVKPAETA